ncbi:hypothetical protein LCGC14_2181990 [marine sediment metagenome]|uniref:Uncharacterized protein n=1 Tax=marine sediment metagenome TaxID=412755 RepID=A0A0F9FZL5_9ZZZZ
MMERKTAPKLAAKCPECGERQGHGKYCVRGADPEIQMLASMVERFSWESDESDN